MADLFGTYSKRIKLTISNTNIDAELTWFPLTVFLTSAQGEEVFAEFDADADFDRCAFTTSDESTQVYADCELFDDSASKAIYHVSKTGWTISNTGTTDFYMYYDNTAGHNTTYISKSGGTAAQSVWNGNFKAVYHMNDGASTSAIYDSTSNNNDGTKKAANEPVEAEGKVGQGQNFDGSDDYISISNDTSIDFADEDFTINLIVKAAEADLNNSRMLCKGLSGGVGKRYELCISKNDDRIVFTIDDNTTKSFVEYNDLTNWAEGNYHMLTFIRDTTNNLLKVYLDGIFEVSNTDSTGSIENINDLQLGRHDPSEVVDYYDGIIDETSISGAACSAAWLKATYNSLWDTLLTYGSEETGGVTYNSIMFGANF